MVVSVLISSPRKGGYGEILAEAVIEGMPEGTQTSVFHLNEMDKVRQCQNCEACQRNGGRCVQKDDIAPIIDSIRDFDGIVFVTSIQFNDMNGLFKTVFDRLYCFLDMNSSTIMEKGKKVAVIVTAGADQDSAERVSGDIERIMVQHFFCESVGRLAYNTWMMPPGMPIDDDTIAKAKEIGSRF